MAKIGFDFEQPVTIYFRRKATPAERALYEEAEKKGFPGLSYSVVDGEFRDE